MARAHRHFIPGHIWHVTHRCHKGEFLLKFAKDRHRWLQWLYQARKRYGLVILNYGVTSNHIHLLVYDAYGDHTISKSIQLVAGRTAQEYNQRKNRKGAFWEDRYHATIIEDGEHLLRCVVYIDLNMVRAGVVDHPEQWMQSGYNEIQKPRRKCILIDQESLRRLAGFDDYGSFQVSHRKWVDSSTTGPIQRRESHWTQAIAVGSQLFVSSVKKKLNDRAKGREIIASKHGSELRESVIPYNALFS